MSTTRHEPESKRAFPGSSPQSARDAASEWLRDFNDHGPLDISSISVSEEGEGFVATVIYSEASIEITPRYFPQPQPAEMRKSA